MSYERERERERERDIMKEKEGKFTYTKNNLKQDKRREIFFIQARQKNIKFSY